MKELECLTFLCLINFRLNSKDIIKQHGRYAAKKLQKAYLSTNLSK